MLQLIFKMNILGMFAFVMDFLQRNFLMFQIQAETENNEVTNLWLYESWL